MNPKCGICSERPCKYKCPGCRLPYCSLTCWKTHQSSECKIHLTNGHVSSKKNELNGYEFETEDTVPQEKLQLLENDEQLRCILKNSHVRKMLRYVDSSSDPDTAIRTAMQDPEFVEFVDRCLQVVEPPPEGN